MGSSRLHVCHAGRSNVALQVCSLGGSELIDGGAGGGGGLSRALIWAFSKREHMPHLDSLQEVVQQRLEVEGA